MLQNLAQLKGHVAPVLQLNKGLSRVRKLSFAVLNTLENILMLTFIESFCLFESIKIRSLMFFHLLDNDVVAIREVPGEMDQRLPTVAEVLDNDPEDVRIPDLWVALVVMVEQLFYS